MRRLMAGRVQPQCCDRQSHEPPLPMHCACHRAAGAASSTVAGCVAALYAQRWSGDVDVSESEATDACTLQQRAPSLSLLLRVQTRLHCNRRAVLRWAGRSGCAVCLSAARTTVVTTRQLDDPRTAAIT